MSIPRFDGTPLGVAALDHDTWVVTLDGPLAPELADELGRRLGKAAPDGTELLLWDETDDDPRVRVAIAGGWRKIGNKAFVEMDLDDVPDVGLPEGWEAVSLSRLGEEEFAKRMLHASAGDPFSRSAPETAVEDLRELIDHAESAFDPESWFAIERDGAELGVVLPQAYADDPTEGTLFYVGVVPSERGNKVGSVLHAFGLAQLKAFGARRYVGSTDERNVAMLKIFAAQGARVLRRQSFYHRPPRVI